MMICSACCSRVEAEIGQNKYFHHIRKVFCKRLIQDGQQNLINFWEVERNVLWVGNSWRIGRRALLGCSHGHPLFLWSMWSCAGLFKAGNSTFLMFSSLRNKMPNIRFFPPFFPPACSCQNRLFSCVLCSQAELCTAIVPAEGGESCSVGTERAFVAGRNFFTSFFSCLCEIHKVLWNCTDSSCQERLFSQLPLCQFQTG